MESGNAASFRLAALHGMLYTGGTAMFDPSCTAQQTLVSTVRNHVTRVQMHSGSTRTHSVCNSSLQCFDISSDGDLIIAIGSRGLGVFYSFSAELALDTISFPPNCNVRCVKMSPCDRFVAIGLESTLQIYAAPVSRTVSFHGLMPLQNMHNCLSQEITSISWSNDSSHLLVSGADARIKIVPRVPRHHKGLVACHNYLSGHRKSVVGAFWVDADAMDAVVSVSYDNVVICWKRTETTRKEAMSVVVAQRRAIQSDRTAFRDVDGDEDDPDAVPESFLERERRETLSLADGEEAVRARLPKGSDEHLHPVLRCAFEPAARHLLRHSGDVTAVAFHRRKAMLAIGYSTGSFALHSVVGAAPGDLPLVQLLSVSSQAIASASFSVHGDYVALGSEHLKQIIVWDWKAESYVLREQSHYYDINTAVFTSDSSSIITGGEEGKVKVWNATTGQCLVTFPEHSGGVTGIAVSPLTNAFFTCSKDGSVRAFDLSRYRNFRVFQASQPTQFSSISVDVSGEVIAAASSRDATITLWAVQTGKIIDELTGHEGAVSCAAFHPSGTSLYTCGVADRTMMVWEIFSSKDEGERQRHSAETIALASEAVQLSFSLNGRRMALLLRSGDVQVYDVVDPKEPMIVATFSTKMDAAGGWSGETGPSTKNADQHFTTIAISPEGDRILLGGESKWIALYHATQGFLLNKWPVTSNLDLQGAVEQFDYRNFSEAGMLNEIDADPDDAQLRSAKIMELPGSTHQFFATGKRKTKLVARAMHVSFASHGRDFIAATTDGLVQYSLSHARKKFAPLQLSQGLTLQAVRRHLEEERFAVALAGALLLNDASLGQECLRRTKATAVPVAVASVPTKAFPEFIRWIATFLENTSYTEQAFTWAKATILFTEEPLFGPRREPQVATSLRLLHKAMACVATPLRASVVECAYMASFVATQAELCRKKQREEVVE